MHEQHQRHGPFDIAVFQKFTIFQFSVSRTELQSTEVAVFHQFPGRFGWFRSAVTEVSPSFSALSEISLRIWTTLFVCRHGNTHQGHCHNDQQNLFSHSSCLPIADCCSSFINKLTGCATFLSRTAICQLNTWPFRSARHGSDDCMPHSVHCRFADGGTVDGSARRGHNVTPWAWTA